jgi:zinc transport system substrate-binding protein
VKHLLIAGLLALAVAGCSRQEPPAAANGKLPVVATIFPVYDFVRAVGGERVAVSLLLPPGAEAHSFEPKPADMQRVRQARLMVFTSPAMEPWADKLLAGAGGQVRAVDASSGIALLPASSAHAGEHGGHDDHGHEGSDPHIWLDFGRAQQMVTTIATALATADPAGKTTYESNAAAYRQQLAALDARYRAGLADCASRSLLVGGHAAFGYLAARYNLTSHAAMGVAANAEPTPRQVAALVDELKQLPVRTVFSEELASPRLAETLAREAGASTRRLHAAHNPGRDELLGGATFISLMDRNLAELRQGLSCR